MGLIIQEWYLLIPCHLNQISELGKNFNKSSIKNRSNPKHAKSISINKMCLRNTIMPKSVKFGLDLGI